MIRRRDGLVLIANERVLAMLFRLQALRRALNPT